MSVNTFKEYYKEFRDSKDLVKTLVKYDRPDNVEQIRRFMKYLVWNMVIDLKALGIKTKFSIPPELKLRDHELNKSKKYLDLRPDLKVKTDGLSYFILNHMLMFFNTDAINLIPLTGKLLPVSEELRKYYPSASFGLVLGINCPWNCQRPWCSKC